MFSNDLRKKFLNFFGTKGHKIVPSSSLIPKDQTVLLTSAGMQQFIPYFSGEKSVLKRFGERHLTSIQKCFRTADIENIGDDTHHTFFEMLGNWSIGEDPKTGYFKKGAIKYALGFFVKELGFNKDKLWATVFKGEEGIPKDEEAITIWKENGISEERIRDFSQKDNFWGPIGNTGPCGPCSEIHYDRGEEYGCGGSDCGPNCEKCDRFVELWNLVFMEYDKKIKNQKSKIKNYEYVKLHQRNIDTGIGFERLLAVLENKDSAYETDLFLPIIKKLEEISDRKYEDNKKVFRIIADHLRGAVFLISDGVKPSNVERGYILRRILRRVANYGNILEMPDNFSAAIIKGIIKNYQNVYPEIESKENDIITIIQNEEEKFNKTLKKGIKETVSRLKKGNIGAKEIFSLYSTYGVPLEIIEELAREYNLKIEDKKKIEEEFKKHQEISRSGAEKKFGGIGKKANYEAVKLHTATHLLHQALRDILGKNVGQMGSDITDKRLRFDFSYPEKMTKKQIEKTEKVVNSKIKENLEVRKEKMDYQKAVESGALAFFKEKYPEKVTVYSIGSFSAGSSRIFSKEICAGPHVKKTSELGRFKIIKEQSSGAGVRRIKAVLN